MRFYTKDNDKEIKEIEQFPIGDGKKKILVLPSIVSIYDSKFISSCIRNAESLIDKEQKIDIYSASYSPNQDKEQDFISYNNNNSSYYNSEAKKIVDTVFLPILKDDKKLHELKNLTIVTYSYGSVVLGMVENYLNKVMDDLGYNEKNKKLVMNNVANISIAPISSINSNSASFKKIFFSPYNDKFNSLYNPKDGSSFVSHNEQPRHITIGKNSLLIKANSPTLKFCDGAPIYDSMAHLPNTLTTQTKDLYTTRTPDIFPSLIRISLNNMIERNGAEENIIEFLYPKTKKKNTTPIFPMGGNDLNFTEKIINKVILDFIKNGNGEYRSMHP